MDLENELCERSKILSLFN
uniref:Uncharacterized protein n=1 Tax=Rhizophora mucronata TaxID=61149 RepID=A0A2P2JUM5_RHIMU